MRVFARAHNERNLAEYQGRTDVDAGLLAELLVAAGELERLVLALDPPA
jgi:hypothetical protein